MRVALVCPYDLALPGGVQNHVASLADQLRVLDDEVVVLGPGTGDAAGAVRVGPSVRIPFNESLAPISLSPLAARRLLTVLRRFRPDIVHVHEPGVPTLSLAATLWGPRPLVATFHAWSDRDRAYRMVRPALRRALGRLDARIAVSRAAASYHARALGISAGSFRLIPNGVNVERFSRAEALPELAAPDVPTVLFVGRLERRKGLEEVVRAFIQLKARGADLRLLVVGEGPERDRCQALLPARLRSEVVFLGRVDHADLPRFYASADVFVAPSLGGESFGVVLLEAMSAGVPVVASSIPGYASVLSDGVDGRLVPPGDARALAEAIQALLGNPALREAMGAEGRRAVARYDWGRVASEIRSVYSEVLASGNLPPEAL